MKKILLIVTITIATIITGIFAPPHYRGQSNNVLAEVVLWPGGGTSRGSDIYYFVIKNNGTLMSYYGRSRNAGFHPRTSNFLMLTQKRDRITLSEEEFLHISRLVNRIIEFNTYPEEWQWQGGVSTNSTTMFLHNGNVYEHSSSWSRPLMELNDIIIELTSLTVRW